MHPDVSDTVDVRNDYRTGIEVLSYDNVAGRVGGRNIHSESVGACVKLVAAVVAGAQHGVIINPAFSILKIEVAVCNVHRLGVSTCQAYLCGSFVGGVALTVCLEVGILNIRLGNAGQIYSRAVCQTRIRPIVFRVYLIEKNSICQVDLSVIYIDPVSIVMGGSNIAECKLVRCAAADDINTIIDGISHLNVLEYSPDCPAGQIDPVMKGAVNT